MKLVNVVGLVLLAGCFAKPPRGLVPMEQAQSLLGQSSEPTDGPLTVVTVTLDAGSEEDPIGFEGLAHATAQSVLSTVHPKDEPDGRADSSQVVTAQVLVDRTVFRSVCASPEACGVDLAHALLQPAFSKPRVDDDIGGLEKEDGRKQQLVQVALLGRPQAHPPRALRIAATPERQRQFHQTHYIKARTSVVASGRDADNVLPAVTQALAPMSSRLPVRVAPLSASPLRRSQILLVEGPLQRVMVADAAVRPPAQAKADRQQFALLWASQVDSIRTLEPWEHRAFSLHFFDTHQPSTAAGVQNLLDEMALVSDKLQSMDPADQQKELSGTSGGFDRYQSEPRMILLTTPDPAIVRTEIEQSLGTDVQDYTIIVIGGEP